MRTFGAIPDDGADDTAAIRAAIDAMHPGQWLVFPAGTYLHNARLEVETPGVVLWSQGATLHATNPRDQAVLLSADGASIYGFTLTAVTSDRRDAPWESRIAIYYRAEQTAPLRNNVIRGNRIVNGPATPNSAAAAGIYVFRADNFLIADNTIRRTLSDGIHVTAGSRNGRLIHNSVRETGDDTIGIVSYLGSGDWTDGTSANASAIPGTERDEQIVRNVVVSHNDLGGQYWGRGISVIGGEDITISDNTISDSLTAAAILLAREAIFTSWGVDNVLVQDNTISRVQTTQPAYLPSGWAEENGRTGHAAVEIHGFVYDDERADAALLQSLAVSNIRVARTKISDTFANGVRIGVGTGQSEVQSGRRADGSAINRRYSGGVVGRIDLDSVDMLRTGEEPLAILSQPSAGNNVTCTALTSDGAPISDPHCGGAPPTVTGSSLSCRP